MAQNCSATRVVFRPGCRAVHGFCVGCDRSSGLAGTHPGTVAGGNGAGSAMRPGYLHAQARVVLDRLQYQLQGWRRGNCVPRSFAQHAGAATGHLAIPAGAVRETARVGGCASQGDADRSALRPRKPERGVLVATDMPLGGPRTQGNLNLLGIAALSCVVLVAIARITRPRSPAVNGGG